ncbi:hypothetical protein [Catellatospora sp. NPDC049609]|uniref:hypothetical protein n=1 Tax=Catellatospora sp. NPDC049609 TaxID=3155505 RepID=UPI0034491DBD
MTRFARWLSASALALLATIVLLPQPAAAAQMPCGKDCAVIYRDAICWEKDWCTVPFDVKGTVPRGGFTVAFRTADGTALAPADYRPLRDGVLPVYKEATYHLLVFVEGDSELEGEEAFLIEYLDREGRIQATAKVTVRDAS